ncbi:MAG: hypothetical protein HC836_15655 [Richelia sp. RM2_1_2]|nr:hypothetical protein [Richelia sp. RM2_1_2]
MIKKSYHRNKMLRAIDYRIPQIEGERIDYFECYSWCDILPFIADGRYAINDVKLILYGSTRAFFKIKDRGYIVFGRFREDELKPITEAEAQKLIDKLELDIDNT